MTLAKTADRPLLKTARTFAAEMARESGQGAELSLREKLVPRLEGRFVSAAWTLRRLPDREAGFRRMQGCLWPETLAESSSYAPESLTSFQARRRVRISAEEIDEMQPTLDLLQLLPDVTDRRILFWTAWHQDGETQARIPWAKVRRSLGANLSRWTLKRRYEGGLRWLAAIIAMQA